MTTVAQRPLVVKACIPHFYSGNDDQSGYGSHRPGARLARSLALSHCLSSLLRLRRSRQDAIIHIGDRAIDHLPPETTGTGRQPLQLEIQVCTDGRHELDDILSFYTPYIKHKIIDVDDPKLLPLAARDELILGSGTEADLYTYLEDDLIIHDINYFDKQAWFLQKTNHRLSLMPHRYEDVHYRDINSLLVDGPLDMSFISRFAIPRKNVASGMFRGLEKVSFDIASNPHSGTFTLSREQVTLLRRKELPTSGFIGPLETAATLTALKFFPVLKPSEEFRSFLMIEHGHPSFRGYTKTLPHRETRGK